MKFVPESDGSTLHEAKVTVEINLDRDLIQSNMRKALSVGYKEFERSGDWKSVSIVAGGPSVKDTWRAISTRPIIACNGAARFLIDKDITPDFGIVADGRPQIVEVVRDAPTNIPWLVASQCSPGVFDALNGADITIWHMDNGKGEERPILEELRPGKWMMIGGGSTVGLRSINLAYLKGAREFHLYGFDSCFVDAEHHCYTNAVTRDDDLDHRFPLYVEGRKFTCSPWMISQAQEYQRLVAMFHDCTFRVHGDGLISWIAKHLDARKGIFHNDN